MLERALAFANDGVIQVEDLSLKAARPADGAKSYEAPAPALPVASAEAPALPAAAPLPAPGAPVALGPDSLPSNLPAYLEQVERDIIQRALQQTQFNRTRTASLLGISVRQLRYQMQKLDIQAPEN